MIDGMSMKEAIRSKAVALIEGNSGLDFGIAWCLIRNNRLRIAITYKSSQPHVCIYTSALLRIGCIMSCLVRLILGDYSRMGGDILMGHDILVGGGSPCCMHMCMWCNTYKQASLCRALVSVCTGGLQLFAFYGWLQALNLLHRFAPFHLCLFAPLLSYYYYTITASGQLLQLKFCTIAASSSF